MGDRKIGVVLAVPEPHGGLLQRRRADYGDPEAYVIPSHITLLPPTAVDPAVLPDLSRHLAAVAAAGSPFPVRLSGTATFRPLTQVVYAALAEGAAACTALQDRLRSGPVRRELDFPYHPHVTLAHNLAPEVLDRAQRELAGFTASWTADAFSLYEQGADGVWQALRLFPLGSARPPAALPHQQGVRPGADTSGRRT